MKQKRKSKNTLYRANLIDAYMLKHNLTQEEFAYETDITSGQLKDILYGTAKSPKINVLKKICNKIGVTLDYFCFNNPTNLLEEDYLEKLGLTMETAELLKDNKPKALIRTTDKKPEGVEHKNYNAILNLFLKKQTYDGKFQKSFMEVFNAKVLNLLICSIIYDQRFMQTFQQDFAELSLDINKNKTHLFNRKATDIDMSFNEIFESKGIQKIYRDSTNELHDCLDKLLKDALEEAFNSTPANNTLL